MPVSDREDSVPARGYVAGRQPAMLTKVNVMLASTQCAGRAGTTINVCPVPCLAGFGVTGWGQVG